MAVKRRKDTDEMSLRGIDTRLELDPDLRNKAEIMAKGKGYPSVNALVSELAEKAIAGEWHAYRVSIERAERSGALRKLADERGRAFGS